MPNKKILGAAAISAALAGGGITGALIGAPSISTAQDSSTTTTQDNGTDDSQAGERIKPAFGWGVGPGSLDVAAEAIGISADDLRDALADGQSIAQVAEARNVEVQTVIDALVADATARLDELKAELPERVTDLVNREGLPRGPGHHGPHFGLGGFDAAAEALGISEDDLRDALADGQSIAEVAEARNVEVQTVIDALVADATARIDDAVADGDLDADEAAEIKEDLPDRITDLVNRDGFPHGPGPGGFGPRGFDA